MAASVNGDDYDDEASLRILDSAIILIADLQGFIVDIDNIQAHGMSGPGTDECLQAYDSQIAGVGAADITKLKANGYYTVAVSSTIPEHRQRLLKS